MAMWFGASSFELNCEFGPSDQSRDAHQLQVFGAQNFAARDRADEEERTSCSWVSSSGSRAASRPSGARRTPRYELEPENIGVMMAGAHEDGGRAGSRARRTKSSRSAKSRFRAP